MALRLSELFVRLRTAFPQIPITTWCDEDTPFIWAKLLREFMSATNSQPVSNAYAIFAQILTREGFERFKGYAKSSRYEPNSTQQGHVCFCRKICASRCSDPRFK